MHYTKGMPDYLTNFFKDKNGKVVLGQTPNAPLVGWFVFLVLAHVIPTGRWQQVAGYVSFGFIFTWAWLELTQGVNYFRRLLGAVVLILAIHSRLS